MARRNYRDQPMGDGIPPRKRVIPRQPTPSPEDQAAHILDQIEMAELKRQEAEYDEIIDRDEQRERTKEKRRKAAEVAERQRLDRIYAERAEVRRAELEMEAKMPKGLEDMYQPQLDLLCERFGVEPPPRGSLSALARMEVIIEALRDAGCPDPLTPELAEEVAKAEQYLTTMQTGLRPFRLGGHHWVRPGYVFDPNAMPDS